MLLLVRLRRTYLEEPVPPGTKPSHDQVLVAHVDQDLNPPDLVEHHSMYVEIVRLEVHVPHERRRYWVEVRNPRDIPNGAKRPEPAVLLVCLGFCIRDRDVKDIPTPALLSRPRPQVWVGLIEVDEFTKHESSALSAYFSKTASIEQ